MLMIVLCFIVFLQALQIPSEDVTILQRPNFSKKYKIIKDSVPPFQFGDFNGDGLRDVIVPVYSVKTGRKGLAIVIKGEQQPLVVGADVPFSNGDALDPSVPLDEWKVISKAEIGIFTDDEIACKGDAIFAKESEAGSGLICLTTSGIYWIQLGD